MAVTAYNARILVAGTPPTFKATLSRNSATQPVDATSAGDGRVTLPFADNKTPPVSTAVTGATNATPIVLTVSSITGFANGDLVRVTGVNGNTNANGTFTVTSVSGSNITLVGSAGNAAFSTSANATISLLLPCKTLQEQITQLVIGLANDYAANG